MPVPKKESRHDGTGVGKKKAKAKSIPKRIRDIRRLLNKPDLAADIRVAQERILASLEEQRSGNKNVMKEKKHQERYRKIKFIERQKLTRKLSSASASLESATTKKEKRKFQAEIDEINAKLLYIEHFPRTQPYISILKDVDDMDEGSATNRKQIFAKIQEEQGGNVSKYLLGSADSEKGRIDSSTEKRKSATTVLQADSFFGSTTIMSPKQNSEGNKVSSVNNTSTEQFSQVEDEILRKGAIHRKTKVSAKKDTKSSTKKLKTIDNTPTPELKRKGAIHRKQKVGNEAGKTRAKKGKKNKTVAS
eukprot:m.128748 g.128748  ORF g.128748 m.128748 type:complete len:305 (+) comp17443_c1_seq1:141-1055(+)